MSGARVSGALVGRDLINGDPASTAALAVLCERVRPQLACLGEAGAPLVAVLRFVEKAGDGRGTEVLADPGFALDVLTAADPGTDPALVGRVLDFLRTRNGADPGANGTGSVIRDVVAAARRCGLRVVTVTTSLDLAAITELVEAQFRPFLPAWLY